MVQRDSTNAISLNTTVEKYKIVSHNISDNVMTLITD